MFQEVIKSFGDQPLTFSVKESESGEGGLLEILDEKIIILWRLIMPKIIQNYQNLMPLKSYHRFWSIGRRTK